jgi:hypothetical protein
MRMMTDARVDDQALPPLQLQGQRKVTTTQYVAISALNIIMAEFITLNGVYINVLANSRP